MTFLELAVLALLLLVTVERAVAVTYFLIRCRWRAAPLGEDDMPRVLVVLALRGSDPSLVDCLRSLFQQDYPHYQVRLVVDHRSDPAWDLAERTIQALDVRHVDLSVLEAPGDTCTLKCSALLQATHDLDESIDVVAFLDTDVAPASGWLRDLVAPLGDERVGAATGNRWYAPQQAYWGSLVRYIWNTAALVNMYYWQVPWGGTLAIRADLLRRSNLRDLWSRAGCDDVPLYSVLRRERLRLVFVPSLLLIDDGDSQLRRCLPFLTRQMLWVRLYHPVCWWACALFHFVTLGSQLIVAALALIAICQLRLDAALWLSGGLLISFAVTLVLVASLDRLAWRENPRVGQRGAIPWHRVAMTLPLAEIVSALALVGALITRSIEWRGIHYRIGGPWKIRMVEYRPFDSKASHELSKERV